MRFSSVFGTLSFALVLSLFNACGDDSSSGIEPPADHGDKPYCEVTVTETGFVQEIYIPNSIWGQTSVSLKDDQMTFKLKEVFYEGYDLDPDSVCEHLADAYADAAGSSFRCNSSGASYVTKRAPNKHSGLH